MTIFSTTQINHLNKMNRSAKDVSLGTVLDACYSGSTTNATAIAALPQMSGSAATVAQMSASSITLPFSLSSITNYVLTVVRKVDAGAGSPLALSTFRVLPSGGSLIISGSGAGSIGVGDRFMGIAQ